MTSAINVYRDQKPWTIHITKSYVPRWGRLGDTLSRSWFSLSNHSAEEKKIEKVSSNFNKKDTIISALTRRIESRRF